MSCIQWGGKGWRGYEISHVLYRMDGVGTWVQLYFILYMVLSYVSSFSFINLKIANEKGRNM